MSFKRTYLTRQAEIIPAEKQGLSIVVVGAGAIGSFTALALAKMGYGNITVYDFDTIDDENMNCQFYRTSDIGKKKAVAIKELVYDFTGFEIKTFDAKVDRNSVLNANIVISAVDSMEVRKLIGETAMCNWLIDPRMGAEYATLDVVKFDKDGQKKYLDSLYTDAEAGHERCTAKSTMYTVNLIAGQVAKAVKDITVEAPYIKTMDWAIDKNAMIAFNSEGNKL